MCIWVFQRTLFMTLFSDIFLSVLSFTTQQFYERLAWTSNGSAHSSPTHLSVQPSGSHRWAGVACQPTASPISCWCPWQWCRSINKRCISTSWESCFTFVKSVARLWETVPKESEKVTSIVHPFLLLLHQHIFYFQFDSYIQIIFWSISTFLLSPDKSLIYLSF